MKKLFFLCFLAAFVYACSGDQTNNGDNNNATESQATDNTSPEATPGSAEAMGNDPEGIGKYRNVEVPAKLDAQLAAKGKDVYDMKCSSCHKLTDEKLVGPGWKGVTERRRPAWIMNFVTNVDEMLDKDAAAKAQLEICLVRMPNQNLSDDDARNVYEFMRQNDGVQP